MWLNSHPSLYALLLLGEYCTFQYLNNNIIKLISLFPSLTHFHPLVSLMVHQSSHIYSCLHSLHTFQHRNCRNLHNHRSFHSLIFHMWQGMRWKGVGAQEVDDQMNTPHRLHCQEGEKGRMA